MTAGSGVSVKPQNSLEPPNRENSAAFERGAVVELEVEGLIYGGDGVARRDGLVFFVAGAAPGDLVRAQVARKKRKHREARVIEIIKPSPARTEPRCPHFGECGGCKLQHVVYETQLRCKESHVRDCLQRIGGIADPPVREITPMPDPWRCRNKMEFAFGSGGGGVVLGLHPQGRFDTVIDVKQCFLLTPEASRILETAREFARRRNLAPYNPRTHEGFLKNLVLRTGGGGGEFMVCIVTTPREFPSADELAEAVAACVPRVKSVWWYRNPLVSGVAIAGEADLLLGKETLSEEISGMKLRVSPESFMQVNARQTQALYSTIVSFAGLTGTETALDLYTGAGPIAMLLARSAKSVTGIESVPEAVRDANLNAAENGIQNVRFLCGQVEKLLPAAAAENPPPHVVVADPPRAGIHKKVIRALLDIRPTRLVYVSCNPAALARDAAALLEGGYRLADVQPVDMFPHTYHVEAVALLTAR
ncbi:MAG: 23S rRNA (uracil(1939)-C(5))-methyltransferase RlmD [bacterium]